MTPGADVPLWLALPVSVLLLAGSALALVGSFGLLRLERFHDRLHAPTLATTLGIGCVLLASALFFSVVQTRLVLHEALIAAIVVVTTPVTLMLLARAALHRERMAGEPGVPPPFGSAGTTDGDAPREATDAAGRPQDGAR